MKRPEENPGNHSQWFHRSSARESVCVDIELIRELYLAYETDDKQKAADLVQQLVNLSRKQGYDIQEPKR